jgi:microcystin-dependent protein
MATPFVAEIRIFGFNFPPVGWAACDGQLLPISQNTAVFSLLGTNYGGNGTSTFGLPNLQGNVPMHWGQGPGLSPHAIGESAGSETVTLSNSEMPSHNHVVRAQVTPANLSTPSSSATLARSSGGFAYQSSASGLQSMDLNTLAPSGGNLPHNNLMPYLTLNFCIALQGLFPSHS